MGHGPIRANNYLPPVSDCLCSLTLANRSGFGPSVYHISLSTYIEYWPGFRAPNRRLNVSESIPKVSDRSAISLSSVSGKSWADSVTLCAKQSDWARLCEQTKVDYQVPEDPGQVDSPVSSNEQ